jgi:hypothetical protein
VKKFFKRDVENFRNAMRENVRAFTSWELPTLKDFGEWALMFVKTFVVLFLVATAIGLANRAGHTDDDFQRAFGSQGELR